MQSARQQSNTLKMVNAVPAPWTVLKAERFYLRCRQRLSINGWA